MSVKLSSLEETLVVPLWHRARVSKVFPALLNDSKAIELVDHLDYDFSTFKQRFTLQDSVFLAIRARQFDDRVRAYISIHPRASVVNLGAGLDTSFFRVDNGSVKWYDLDLPNVIALRQQLLPETERVHYIAKSLFDMSWCDDIDRIEKEIFIFANGVLAFFEEVQVKHFLSALADLLPGAEFVFDTNNKLGASMINRSLQYANIPGITVKWELDEARIMAQWDSRLKLIEQASLFSTRRDPGWGDQIVKSIDFLNERNAFSIVHVQI